jgi:hypothetical protein
MKRIQKKYFHLFLIDLEDFKFLIINLMLLIKRCLYFNLIWFNFFLLNCRYPLFLHIKFLLEYP